MSAATGHPSCTCPASTTCACARDPCSLAAGGLLHQASHLGRCDCRTQRPPAGWRPPAATPRSGFASFPQPRRQVGRGFAANDSKLGVPLAAPRESHRLTCSNPSLCARLPGDGEVSVKPEPLGAPARGHAPEPERAARPRPFGRPRRGSRPGQSRREPAPTSALQVRELLPGRVREPPAGGAGRVK